MSKIIIEGNIVDVVRQRIYPASIIVENGIIISIEEKISVDSKNYIMPGFIDSHVHIESSMLVPSEFARMAVVHGTVASVSDPHEIANVLGMEGIEFMLNNGKEVPFKFNFGAPSCVPATTFETAGSSISGEEIDKLLSKPDINYLSEMMNFPGVIYEFPDVIEKIKIAHDKKVPIDGHAPGLTGENLKKYASNGITTDHESLTLDEALEKLNLGMKILIREGSAAKDYETFSTLIDTHPDMCMFCSDDKHPDDLAVSHINQLVKKWDHHHCRRDCNVRN